MKSTKVSRSSATSKTAGHPGPRKLIRREWPFLLYPALVAAALVVLYIANRPRPENPSLAGGRAAAQKPAGSPAAAGGISGERIPSASTDPNPGAGRVLSSSARGRRPVTGDSRKPEADPRRATASDANAPGSAGAGPAVNEPPIVAALRRAVQTQDHAALKNCLDQLVALGDQGIAPLCDVIARGGDASAVWAAEALARIGTPAATESLLNTLAEMSDGVYREQITRKLSSISNHDSWPVLLDAIQTSQDAAVRRAAGAALARMADAPIVDELVSRYDSASTIDEAEGWADAVSHISSSKATEPLLTLARQVPAFSEDPLDQAILSAVANVGDAQGVNYLLSRIEASQPGETAYLMNVISQINQPQAQATLLYAAAGNKGLSAEQGRTAAIQALANYPNEQSYVLLEQIVSVERNAAVATAASRAIEAIQHASPMLAANAQFRANEQIVVTSPVRK